MASCPLRRARARDPGVAIDYHLAAAPKALAIEILDAGGKLIQRFDGKAEAPKKDGAGDDDEEDGPPKPPIAAMKPGMNRFTWPMRHPGYVSFEGMIFWAAGNRGVLALPGNYTARLIVDGKAQDQRFSIAADPRVAASPADLQARYDLAQAVTARVNAANQAVLLVRGIRAQADALAKIGKPLPAAVATLLGRLAAIEAEIYQVKIQSRQDPLNYPIKLNNKLAALIGIIESADAPPTEGTRLVFADLSAQLDVQLQALAAVLASELPPANAALTAAGLPPLMAKPLPPADERTKTAETDQQG